MAFSTFIVGAFIGGAAAFPLFMAFIVRALIGGAAALPLFMAFITFIVRAFIGGAAAFPLFLAFIAMARANVGQQGKSVDYNSVRCTGARVRAQIAMGS